MDKQMQKVLDKLAELGAPPITQLSPENARQVPTPTNAVQELLAEGGKPALIPVGKVDHKLIPRQGGEILTRVYTPLTGKAPFPVLLYFHGGGWVIANLDTYDASCRALCNAAECVVVSVAYRQAPEHPFPAAVEDAYTAYGWVLENAAAIGGDSRRVAVAGESAGGNLAAVVSLMARNDGARLPVHQLLVYPVTQRGYDFPSYKKNADAKPLSTDMMVWFWKQYHPSGSDDHNPYLAPLHAADLSGLPPATVIMAEIDPLRDEGEAYAKALRKAGVDVESKTYHGVAHEFFGMAAVVDEAKKANLFAVKRLRKAF